MINLFKKKAKKFDENAARGELLRRWDALNDKIYRQGVTGFRNRFVEMRKAIQSAEIDEEIYTSTLDTIDEFEDIETIRLCQAVGIEPLLEKMEKIMFFKKNKQQHISQSSYQPTKSSEELRLEEVESKIKEIYSEIKKCENDVRTLEKNKQYYLENRMKVDWKMTDNELKQRQRTLEFKQSQLDTLLKTKNNLIASRNIKEMDGVKQTVSSAASFIKVDDMIDITENFQAVSQQVEEDSCEIDELVFGQKTMDDEFDLEYEKFLAQSDGSIESQDKEKRKA